MPKFLIRHKSPASFGAEWSLSKHGLDLPGSASDVCVRGSEWF